ncbi:MAG: four helix bundle protein [Anaerolineae bacterium]
MGKAEKFQDLEVWQHAHQLVLEVYRVCRAFPSEERYGLTSQLQRAAVSVPANIAEGFKRIGKGDKTRFYNIAETSLEEVKYYFILAKDLGYLDANQQLLDDAEAISRMLFRLIQSINQRQ